MRGADDWAMVQHLQKALDLQETDKDTLHLLVFLLMQFLAQPQYVRLGTHSMAFKYCWNIYFCTTSAQRLNINSTSCPLLQLDDQNDSVFS